MIFFFRGTPLRPKQKQMEAFRKFFGKLEQIRVKIEYNVPMLGLTATATKELISVMKKKLLHELPEPVISAKNPIQKNVKFVHIKTDLKKFKMIYYWVVYILMETENSEKYLIFCRSAANCGEIYAYCNPSIKRKLFLLTPMKLLGDDNSCLGNIYCFSTDKKNH